MGICDLQLTYYKYVLNLHNTIDDALFLVPFPYWFGRTFLPFSYGWHSIPHRSFPIDAKETFGRYFLADCMTDALVWIYIYITYKKGGDLLYLLLSIFGISFKQCLSERKSNKTEIRPSVSSKWNKRISWNETSIHDHQMEIAARGHHIYVHHAQLKKKIQWRYYIVKITIN